MLKKIVALLMTCVLSMSLVGCSTSDSSDKTTTKKPATSNSIKIKDVNDFQEADGLIKYFTIDDKKIAIPETVGEYVNYLSQVGTVTLNDTGDKVEDVELEGNGISSMAAYLNVELDSGDVAHFYLRYENPTKKAISVAEASVTFIEVKYDEYAEGEYDKAAKDVVVETSKGSIPLDNKMKFSKVKDILGEPEQNTDGRFHYSNDAGYKYMFDCCNENRNGIFRGFSIEYPSK